MNIQRKNSTHHFRMQSEREQTLRYSTVNKTDSNFENLTNDKVGISGLSSTSQV